MNSARRYAAHIERPCAPTKGTPDNFVWGHNVYDSPFTGDAAPIFSVVLSMNENGPFYVTEPDEFKVR